MRAASGGRRAPRGSRAGGHSISGSAGYAAKRVPEMQPMSLQLPHTAHQTPQLQVQHSKQLRGGRASSSSSVRAEGSRASSVASACVASHTTMHWAVSVGHGIDSAAPRRAAATCARVCDPRLVNLAAAYQQACGPNGFRVLCTCKRTPAGAKRSCRSTRRSTGPALPALQAAARSRASCPDPQTP